LEEDEKMSLTTATQLRIQAWYTEVGLYLQIRNGHALACPSSARAHATENLALLLHATKEWILLATKCRGLAEASRMEKTILQVGSAANRRNERGYGIGLSG
jgi:hypothetical protein